MTENATEPKYALLRDPAHQVSPKAVTMWRTGALIEFVLLVVALVVLWIFVPSHPWWMVALYLVVLLPQLAVAIWMPAIRFRIHRWEVTPGAIYTRSGWINTTQRIAPLSRVQTVDTRRGAFMRLFGLATVTVTTASAAGEITIDGLHHEVARQVVADLTEITAADEGDAT